MYYSAPLHPPEGHTKCAVSTPFTLPLSTVHQTFSDSDFRFLKNVLLEETNLLTIVTVLAGGYGKRHWPNLVSLRWNLTRCSTRKMYKLRLKCPFFCSELSGNAQFRETWKQNTLNDNCVSSKSEAARLVQLHRKAPTYARVLSSMLERHKFGFTFCVGKKVLIERNCHVPTS